MCSEDAEEISLLLNQLGILSLDDEFIFCFRRGDFGAIKEDFPETLAIDDFSHPILTTLEDLLIKHRATKQELHLWTALQAFQCSGVSLSMLAFALLSKESSLYNHGLILYAILLGMDSASEVWNPVLFHTILAHLITAHQLLDGGGQLTGESKETLTVTISLLSHIGVAVELQLLNRLEFEVLVAFIEITVRLTTGMKAEFEVFNSAIGDAAGEVLVLMSGTHVQFMLPFLVSALLLEFASATTSFTARLEHIRARLLKVTESISVDRQDYPIFCKHLIMRAPEKAHLRKSAVFVATRLIERSIVPYEITYFVLQLAHASKVGGRVFALQLLSQIIVGIEHIMQNSPGRMTELTLTIWTTQMDQLNDVAPTVRAAALNGIADIVAVIDDHVCSEILRQIVNLNSLVEVLVRPMTDEKLVVRRAALACVNQILRHSPGPSQRLADLVADRVRDRATSVRQQAINVLNLMSDRFHDNGIVKCLWLDSILPLIVDSETSIQNEAFEAIKTRIFEPIALNKNEFFTPYFTVAHFDFMRNVFAYFKQKAISLAGIAQGLTKAVLTDPLHIEYWILLDILTVIEPSHVKTNKLLELWPLRNTLPAEYFATLAHLNCTEVSLVNDLVSLYHSLVSSLNAKYAVINALLLLLHVQLGDDDKLWISLLQDQCESIMNAVMNGSAVQEDLFPLCGPLYALACLIQSLRFPTVLENFDFRGIDVLLLDRLPNKVTIPSPVRALAAIVLGRLCLRRLEYARDKISIFVDLLTDSNDDALKCNCLVCLCDLCVHYSALVDDHVSVMTNSIADESPDVRRQTLHILTRLIVDDYIKMRTMLFFKFVWALTDPIREVSSFAQSCLFDVLTQKFPMLVTDHVIDAIFFFSCEIDNSVYGPSEEEARVFGMSEVFQRKRTWDLMIDHLSETKLYVLIEHIFNRVFQRFLAEELNIKRHQIILSESIYVLIRLENMRRTTMETEGLTEESQNEQSLDSGKQLMNDIHTKTISALLPILNGMHKLLRIANSQLQTPLYEFYKCICEKNHALFTQLERIEPILAAELKSEMGKSMEIDIKETPWTAERVKEFDSPLLAQIAHTPRTLLCSPGQKTPGTPERVNSRREFSTPTHDDDID
jgi:condensin-2 complex subunit D3